MWRNATPFGKRVVNIIKKKKCLLFKHEKNNQTLSNDWPTYCHTGKRKLWNVFFAPKCKHYILMWWKWMHCDMLGLPLSTRDNLFIHWCCLNLHFTPTSNETAIFITWYGGEPDNCPPQIFFSFIFSFWLPLSDSMNSIGLLYFHFKIHSYLSQF
jgi:hypothetical protein